MNIRSRLLVAALLVALVAAGCASGGSDDVPDDATSVDASSATTTPIATGAPADSDSPAASATSPVPAATAQEEIPVVEEIEGAGTLAGGSVVRSFANDEYPQELSGIVGRMIDDLAATAGVEAAAISVVSLDEVTWSDASLGCPLPGFSYPPEVTDGMRVILEAGGTFYDYRSAGVGVAFACAKAPRQARTTAGVYSLTEDGGVVQVEPPKVVDPAPSATPEGTNPPAPSEGTNPPDA